MPNHADFVHLVPDVLGMYGLWPLDDPEPVTSGTLNWNYRVRTDGGEYFLRRYRDDLETPRIQGEHALVAWASERGIPAPVPEQVPERGTIAELGGGRWALYPWVDGEVRPRGSLTSAQATTLGMAHGATQAILATHPVSDSATMTMSWDKQQSVDLLVKVRAAAVENGAESWIVAGLERQSGLLDSLDVLPPAAFATLPCQVLHGDFHDGQVIWEGDDVAAIVDWEIWHADPRAWELIRSLSFSKLFESPLLEDYLRGYRCFVQLSAEECRLGLRLWWQSRVVGVWAWQARYLQGNRRVEAFFPAMIHELERASDEGWKASIEERFVTAACG